MSVRTSIERRLVQPVIPVIWNPSSERDLIGLASAVILQGGTRVLLPAVAAVQTADGFRDCSLPRITGGLCHTENDVRAAIASGCLAVTNTSATLWRMNGGA